MSYNDQNISCRDCSQNFVWSAGEQEFYASKNLSSPTRCKDCRRKRREDRRFGRGQHASHEPREKFPITCAECGREGEVPFKPRTFEVYCAQCFAARKGQGPVK